MMLRGFGCHLPSLESDCAREANIAASEGKLRRLRLYRVAGLTLMVSVVASMPIDGVGR